MATVGFLLVIISVLTGSAFSQETTICSPEERQRALQPCLSGIWAAAHNNEQYWFGSNFFARCPDGPSLEDALCFQPPGLNIPQSIWSLTFTPGTFETNTLDRYLNVEYNSPPGTFYSCGNTFRWDTTETFTADALSEKSLGAFETRFSPEYSWDSNEGEYYTLMMMDPGFNWIHELYVNIPGDDISQAEVVAPYFAPGNPSRIKNVFSYMLFKQNGRITVDQRYENLASPQARTPFNATEFLQVHSLEGPVGMNIVLVSSDAFSVERAKMIGINTCASFIGDATKNDPKTRPFIPQDYNYTVFVNVTYISDAIDFPSCCSQYHYDAKNVSLNPIGSASVKAGYTRDTPRVELYPKTLFFDPTTGFQGKRYTLVMVDPDAVNPDYGSNDKPFLHWLVVNIPDGKVDRGDEVVDYIGPSPPAPPSHYYYFLLYQQKGDLQSETVLKDYTTGCESCQFDVTDFASDNDLELVGASWMLVGVDEYVRYTRVVLWNESITTHCADVTGYTEGCLPSGGALPVLSTLTLLVAFVLAIDIGNAKSTFQI